MFFVKSEFLKITCFFKKRDFWKTWFLWFSSKFLFFFLKKQKKISENKKIMFFLKKWLFHFSKKCVFYIFLKKSFFAKSKLPSKSAYFPNSPFYHAFFTKHDRMGNLKKCKNTLFEKTWFFTFFQKIDFSKKWNFTKFDKIQKSTFWKTFFYKKKLFFLFF